MNSHATSLRNTSLLLLIIPYLSWADSGGPYEYVPDPGENITSAGAVVLPIPKHSAPLDFYTTHRPDLVHGPDNLEPTGFQWVSGRAGSIEELDYNVVAIRYLDGAKLKNGMVRAYGLLVVTGDSSGQFIPVYYLAAGAGTENITARSLRLGQSFTCYEVSDHISGTGGFVDNVYLTREGDRFRRYNLWGSTDAIWEKLKSQGYELWHRGHWKDIQKLITVSHIYRDAEKHAGDGNPHRWLVIQWEFKDTRLEVKDWKLLDEPPSD